MIILHFFPTFDAPIPEMQHLLFPPNVKGITSSSAVQLREHLPPLHPYFQKPNGKRLQTFSIRLQNTVMSGGQVGFRHAGWDLTSGSSLPSCYSKCPIIIVTNKDFHI